MYATMWMVSSKSKVRLLDPTRVLNSRSPFFLTCFFSLFYLSSIFHPALVALHAGHAQIALDHTRHIELRIKTLPLASPHSLHDPGDPGCPAGLLLHGYSAQISDFAASKQSSQLNNKSTLRGQRYTIITLKPLDMLHW
jgi:hypothetical protein